MVDTGRSQFLEMVDQRLAAETCAEADRLGQGVCIIDQIEVEGADERALPDVACAHAPVCAASFSRLAG